MPENEISNAAGSNSSAASSMRWRLRREHKEDYKRVGESQVGIRLQTRLLSFCFKLLFIYFQRQGKGGEKRGRETWLYKRNISWVPLACPHPGTWPPTQRYALTGNRTSNFSVHRPVLHPLNHTSQDLTCFPKSGCIWRGITSSTAVVF